LIAYADTGFLVSLYGQDDLSEAAAELVKSKPVFVLTALGEAEFLTALELRVFRKEWTRREARRVRDLFLQHQAAGVFRPAPLGSEIWEMTMALGRRYSSKLGARTLDLLHVASAIQLKPDVFYSFDKRQRKLARAERLPTLPA
jgi:predicted nucleic acid-binding protein